MTIRGDLLTEAARLTEGDRLKDYGPPVANHRHIAAIASAITGHNLSARDIALILVATKLARLAKSPQHFDSYADGAAYLAIAYECAVDEPPP